MSYYTDILGRLGESGNLRTIPAGPAAAAVDFSTNDYMGLASRRDLQERFMADPELRMTPMSSSASRLLASHQREHTALENLLSTLYGRDILLFNSGYHANSGIIPSLAEGSCHIVADKLVHASIIDGMVLSRARFTRYAHNDMEQLDRILAKVTPTAERVLVVTESVFSMDGDSADIEALARLKRRYPNVLLYVDEAHAFGVCGERGLGLSQKYPEVDVIVGTFGKAAASSGAFAAVSPDIKRYLINRARSFIFSTALPPITSAWTRFMVEQLTGMDAERRHLGHLSAMLHPALSGGTGSPSHIQPLIVGDPIKAVDMSTRLLALGYKALPIRTPTVPAGTERLRFSVSAAMTDEDIRGVINAIAQLS